MLFRRFSPVCVNTNSPQKVLLKRESSSYFCIPAGKSIPRFRNLFSVNCKQKRYRIHYHERSVSAWLIVSSYRLARLNGELLDKNGKKSIYNCENYKYLLDAPFKISARCCYHMKKAPLNKFERQSGRHPITGVLACESKLREQSWIKFGCNGFERQRPLSQPLAFWLEEDILRYLKMTGIPYAPIYGDIVESRKKNGTPILKTTGVSRSGCMYCMYGVHLEHEPNRFQLMQVTHPQQYDYCINKLGCGAVLDYIGVPYRNQQLEVDHC